LLFCKDDYWTKYGESCQDCGQVGINECWLKTYTGLAGVHDIVAGNKSDDTKDSGLDRSQKLGVPC